jgi:2-oxoisovalerate dehydrogenase E2 component (dihydrolipoyl transacylase)
MGTFTFRLPDIGEGIAEAEIVAWHVKVGDVVAEDGRVADLMTDKATVEMESPVSGRIISVAGEVGDVIAIGSPLVVIETGGDEAEAVAEVASGPSTGSGRAEVVEAAAVDEPAVVELPAPDTFRVQSEERIPYEHAPRKALQSGRELRHWELIWPTLNLPRKAACATPIWTRSSPTMQAVAIALPVRAAVTRRSR